MRSKESTRWHAHGRCHAFANNFQFIGFPFSYCAEKIYLGEEDLGPHFGSAQRQFPSIVFMACSGDHVELGIEPLNLEAYNPTLLNFSFLYHSDNPYFLAVHVNYLDQYKMYLMMT